MKPERQYLNDVAAFAIFRGNEAVALEEALPMSFEGLTPSALDGLGRLAAAGVSDGADVRLIFDAPGFSLTYAKFKSGFPLPRHSHRSDCLYYITGGSLRLGTETLVKGDGFFLPAGTPYTYKPGDEGVEVLEIRHESCADIRLMAGPAFWDKAVAVVKDRQVHWSSETVS